MKKQVGKIDSRVIALLGLTIDEDTPIFLGDSNVTHMKNSHPDDFKKYGADIELILSSPDYIGINPTDNSLEYVKEYCVDNEFVKIAVRVSASNTFFARSLYILNNNRVHNFIAKGTLKKY